MGVYDGDTPYKDRTRLRSNARLVISYCPFHPNRIVIHSLSLIGIPEYVFLLLTLLEFMHVADHKSWYVTYINFVSP